MSTKPKDISVKKQTQKKVIQEPSLKDAKKVVVAEAHSIIKCARCGSDKTARQLNGKSRWFSQALGGFSKNPYTEPVLCESCQRKDRKEMKAILADEEKRLNGGAGKQ